MDKYLTIRLNILVEKLSIKKNKYLHYGKNQCKI